jgi:predicted dithiol-disulfide oxidoreductase (DUF899 family)
MVCRQADFIGRRVEGSTMSYRDTVVQLNDYRQQIAGIRSEMHALQAQVEPEPVEDYVFDTPDGQVALSELFGDKADLFIIHNMGKTCPACTMWADGFNGVLAHLENRAAFVVTTPDDPKTQAAFAQSRGWRFRMASHANSSFAVDMGYRSEKGFQPGVSVFRKEGGRVVRVSDTGLGPGDDFCAVWHFFEMLPEGPAGWRAKFAY